MKKAYAKPISEIEEFKTADVVTASYGDGGEAVVPGGDEDLG